MGGVDGPGGALVLLSGIAWHSAWISHFGSLMHRYMLLQLIELTYSTLSQETINYTVSTS